MEYKRIPKMVNCTCSICKEKLTQKKSAKIYVYDNEMNYKMINSELYFCPYCAICYADGKTFTNIRQNNPGFRAVGYILSTSKEKKEVLKKYVQTFPVGCGKDIKIAELLMNELEHQHEGFSTRTINKYEKISTVFVANEYKDKCPICSRILVSREICIPVSKEKAVYFRSKCCGNHFLVYPSRKFFNLINGNPYASHIKIDYSYYFRCYREAWDVYSNWGNYNMLFFGKSMSKRSKEIALIIGDTSKNVNEYIRILDYRESETRKLLVSLLRDNKNLITFQGEKYELRYQHKDFSEVLFPECLKIKTGGGYWSSVRNKRYQMVDILMFSPFTQNFEISHATYDEEEDECFMDISVFRNFINKFGNPGIRIYAVRKNSFNNSDFLNDESLLHVFGYSVNQRDNLSAKVRQEILAEVIDLGLMNIPTVLRLLKGCNDRARGNQYYEACYKYEEDIKFVSNYRFNPDRFLVLNN